MPKVPVRLFPLPEHVQFQQPVFANDCVRYVGEAIAVVIAESPALAEDALDHIVVEIDPLPAVADMKASLSNETLLFEGHGTNCAMRYRAAKGDTETAFSEADYRREETFYVHRHTGIMMEPRGLLADWDEARQRMTVWGATKVPFANRRILSELMGLAEDSIDMMEGDSGGSFGVRGEFFPEDFIIPFAARRLGRPVKWIEDRREHFLSISHARDIACTVEIACRKNGEILGLRGRIHVNVGAYMRTATVITPRNVGQFIPGPYRIENIDFDVAVQFSNKAPSGTYRGPGRYEADFYRERMIDLAAKDLGLDRVAIRRRNLVPESAMPYPLPEVTPSPNSTALDSGAYGELLDRCLAESKWDEISALEGRFIDGRYHGTAVACFIEGGAAGPRENARIVVEADGYVSVYVGSSAVGQGVETILGQIGADALDMPFEKIRVFHGSTIYVQEGWGSYHSRSTVMGGSAILLAADEVKGLLRDRASQRFNCGKDEVTLQCGTARAPDGRTLPYSDLAEPALSAEATYSNHRHTYAYGTHVAHVAVDPKSGHIDILDYVAFEDAGRIINPLTLHGQAIGAIIQGLGGTLLEELVYAEDGQMLTGSFADYLMPLATDFPNVRAVSVGLRPSPFNPLGAKGAGEGGIIPVGGLIANAVANALRDLDVQPKTLPLSPPRVWQLIAQAKGMA